MVKKILQQYISNIVGIVLAALLLEGFSYNEDIITLLFAGGVLLIVMFVVKPLIKIIAFPINVITLGVFGIFINAILLYITDFLVDNLSITEGYLKLDFLGILSLTLSDIYLSGLLTLLASSFIISIVNWLIKKLLF